MPISPFQSSFSQQVFKQIAGQRSRAFGPEDISNKISRGLIQAGRGVFKVPSVGGAGSRNSIDPGEVFQVATGGVAADVDAILATGGASASTLQTISGAALNGVVGTGTMQPGRNITLVLSSHTDWDATNATLTGTDLYGRTVSETLAIPDGGNATVTSTNRYSAVTSLTIPAQTGAGGTFTLGISALSSGLTLADFKGVAVHQPVKTSVNNLNLYGYPGVSPTNTTEASYIDGELVPCMVTGGIVVQIEEDVSDGDPVYVRVASGAGGSLLGKFRNDADTASCIIIPQARFVRDGTLTSGLCEINLLGW